MNEPGYAAMTFKTYNLGDDIQSLAAQRFLPRIDLWVDRDHSRSLDTKDRKYRFIMNGWFGQGISQWPPSPKLIPLLLSVHIAQGCSEVDLLSSEEAIEFYRKFGPVGCRDLETVSFFQNLGVEAYFSGCLTLTLEPTNANTRGDHVLLVDVGLDEEPEIRYRCRQHLLGLLAESKMKFTTFSHCIEPTRPAIERLMSARRALDAFSSAALVVTSRLHCALPCLALGVPVLFVKPRYPEGRLEGLVELTRNCSSEELLRLDKEQLFLPNPDEYLPVAERLRHTCHDFLNR